MSNPLILIVEDNQDNRTLINDILSMLDYKIIEAEDGEIGVKMALEHKPDLILMDLSLPHKDGWTATRELKATKIGKNIPILALTAHAMVGDKERALEAGCDDYLTKPVNMVELMQKIKMHLANSQSSKEK